MKSLGPFASVALGVVAFCVLANTGVATGQAVGDETAEWQRLIDAVSKRGGGRVSVRSGVHWTGQLEMRSNVELHLERCAVLKGLGGLQHYRVVTLPYSEGAWSGVVVAMGVTNVSITGEGVIDGNGSSWPLPAIGGGDAEGERPRGIVFANCRDIRLEDFTLRDSGSWGCVFKCCDGALVRHVKIDNHANSNNDGFDIEGKNVLIEDCDVDSGDDAYCLKSNDPGFVVENVRIRNCVARSHCNGFKIGTATHGTVRNVRVEHCRAEAPRRDFLERRQGRENFGRNFFYRPGFGHLPNGVGLGAITIENVDGGTVEDVTVEDMLVAGFMCPLFIRGDQRIGRSCGTPPSDKYVFQHIVIRNLRGRAEGFIASSVTGVDGCVVKDVVLEDIDITCRGADAQASRVALVTPVPDVGGAYPECTMFSPHILPAYGLYVDHVDGVSLRNVQFALSEGAEEQRPSVVFTRHVTGKSQK